MNPWLYRPGVPVDQADPASCTAASVSSLSASAIDLAKTNVNELLGLKPASQEKINGLWLRDIDQQVAAWRKMVLTDERTPMADRAEMVLRDERTLRDSIAKEKIAKIMEAVTTPSIKDHRSKDSLLPASLGGFKGSNAKMSEDGQTYTCDITVPVPLDYIRLDLKL